MPNDPVTDDLRAVATPKFGCDHDHDNKGCTLSDDDKDYVHECINCGAKPTVHPTDLCGPCCFGEAETINGNW